MFLNLKPYIMKLDLSLIRASFLAYANQQFKLGDFCRRGTVISKKVDPESLQLTVTFDNPDGEYVYQYDIEYGLFDELKKL